MIAVCDASPLIAFSSVDKLYLLQQLFDSVIIPSAVCDEVFISTKTQILHPDFILVKPLVSETSARFLKMNLRRRVYLWKYAQSLNNLLNEYIFGLLQRLLIERLFKLVSLHYRFKSP